MEVVKPQSKKSHLIFAGSDGYSLHLDDLDKVAHNCIILMKLEIAAWCQNLHIYDNITAKSE